MRNWKKIASAALALMMALALMVPAMAAPNEGKITITNADPGQTYTIYKLFDLDGYNDEAYSYKVNETWGAFARSDAAKSYVAVDDQGYVTWVENADPAAFAKLALEYAANNSIEAEGSDVAPAAAEGATTSTLAFTGLPLGYYLIDSSMGALCALDTTNNEAVVKEKNEAPTVKKNVSATADGTFGDNAIVPLGGTAYYTITIEVKAGAQNYKLHDTMDTTKLKFNNDVEVTAVDKEGTTKNVIGRVSETPDTGDTFTVTFEGYDAGDTITVKYTATVIAASTTALENKASVSYGEDSETPEDPADVYNAQIAVYKTGQTDKDVPATALAGAGFVLKNEDGKYYSLVKNNNSTPDDLSDDYNEVTWVDSLENADVHTSGEDGNVPAFEGLKDGTYTLVESVVPEGYNKAQDKEIKIEGNNYDGSNLAQTAEVLNLTGALLPSTGGIGTTIFYIVGGVLVAGAVILLVTRKRVSEEQ